MTQHIFKNQIPNQGINLIYGCRKKNNLLYFDELRKLEQEMRGFRYYPTLSREEWEGKTGYVHDIYESICQNQNPAYFFLCGWKAMIDEAKTRIMELGYDKKDIHVELYG
jgi:CDP-4-dehydro-6-deoxyglucose reductase